MRSCLMQLLITAAVIFALLWFGLPFGASWLSTNALNAAGFTGTDTKVAVSATLPPRMLLGHADSVRLTSTKVSVGDLHADAVDVTLTNVELFDRTFSSVHGSLSGVRVPTTTGDFITAESVALDGTGTNAQSTLTLANSELETLAATRFTSVACHFRWPSRSGLCASTGTPFCLWNRQSPARRARDRRALQVLPHVRHAMRLPSTIRRPI
jgi:hypothetical protein